LPSDCLHHDLAFAWAERVKSLSELVFRFCALSTRAIPGKTSLDGIEQVLIPEWLGQELDGSSLHRLHAHRDIAMRRDENDGQFAVCRGQRALEVESTRARHSHVDDQASRAVRQVGPEKVGNSRKLST